MTDRTNDRKVEHIRIIGADRETDRNKMYFDRIRLTHRALPELDLAAIDTSVSFMGRRLSFPLLISSMTGGDHDVVRRINRNLAEAAEAERVAMGVGSQRVLFTHPSSRSSFALRDIAPTALLFANLGAVQLNLGLGLDDCREAVAVLRADALCLHLNPLQEAVQPEGDTRFAGLADRIGAVVAGVGCPVVLKEVGAGLSLADARLAMARGVRYLDVAGSGGTSWSRIEHHRGSLESDDDLGLLFQDWGLPTPYALRQLAPLRPAAVLIASGGIRSGIDMAKALVLGASLCGVASPFLGPAMDSAASVRRVIQRLRREFVTALFLLGVGRAEELIGRGDLLLEPIGGECI